MCVLTLPALLRLAILAITAACATAVFGADFEVRTESNEDRATILMSGRVAKGDPQRFGKALREAKRARPALPPLLALDSPGGDLDTGLAVARAVRREGMPTAVAPMALCASACSLIFFGGFDRERGRPDRTVYGRSARLGVHRWSRKWHVHGLEVPATIQQAHEQKVQVKLTAFYDEMNVSPAIRDKAEQTSAERLYYLGFHELTGSQIDVRSAFDDKVRLASPHTKWPCELRCLLRTNVPWSKVTWPQTALAALGLDDHVRVMSGTTYLTTWPSLFGRTVRTVCIVWHLVDDDFACVASRVDGSLGYIMLRRSLPVKPAAAQLAILCGTTTPSTGCRMEITGLVRQTPAGPFIYDAKVRPAPLPPNALPAVISAATN